LHQNIACCQEAGNVLDERSSVGCSVCRLKGNGVASCGQSAVYLCFGLVAPGRDAERPPKKRGKRSTPLDHFFPKERYPFFSIHPVNLVPLCTACNTNAKSRRDPIDEETHGNAPLLNTFHPYYRPAIKDIDVRIIRNDLNVRKVDITEKADGSKSIRIKKLNDLFDLESDWDTRIKSLVERQLGALLPHIGANANKHAALMKDNESAENVETQLRRGIEMSIQEMEDLIGSESNYVIYSKYLRYVLDDTEEFRDLISVFKDKNNPASRKEQAKQASQTFEIFAP
jgi:hypothetical protein